MHLVDEYTLLVCCSLLCIRQSSTMR